MLTSTSVIGRVRGGYKTCWRPKHPASEKSRNFSTGILLGQGQAPDPAKTVEGLTTAQALTAVCRRDGIELPLIETVNAIASSHISVSVGIDQLMRRPLKPE